MKYARAALVALLLVFFVSLGFGTSARPIGPLAQLDELAVQVMRGDSLGLEPDRGNPIFADDLARVSRLEGAMKTALSQRLTLAGLRVNDQSENVVQFNLFGGTFNHVDCEPHIHFMLQVQFCRDGNGCTQERTILGVVEEAGLEQRVVEAAVTVINELIEERAEYRATNSKD